MIKVIVLGKIKEQYLKDLIDDYKKRIEKYTKFSIIELLDYKDTEVSTCLLKEKQLILKQITPKDNLVVLDINGETFDSVSFAKFIEKELTINSNITFIIGSSNGLSPDILNMANKKISFSKMTFPHGLFRAMLLEQIYRSFKILNNETYHK